MRLAIIVARFNPCGYVRPQQNFKRFIDAVQKQIDIADVHVGEALFDRQFTDGWWEPIKATDQNLMWQKEALINLAIRSLPAEYDAVAWVDGDLLFGNGEWYATACAMLSDYPVLQLYETVTYLAPDGRTPQRHGCGAASAGDRLTFRAPGGAIACRRELVENGLYDRNIMGGGDQVFMGACLGTHRKFWIKRNKEWKVSLRDWSESFGVHPVGVVPGNVRHLFHGTRANRQYLDRHAILQEHEYNPETDVRVGENGLLEWASDKPALHQAVRDYFTTRQEDS